MELRYLQTLLSTSSTKMPINTPDPLLNIFGKIVGSDLISSVIAVSKNLISLLRKGLGAVLRRIIALHHSPSLCAILNTQ